VNRAIQNPESRVQSPEPRKPEGHPQITQITQIARKEEKRLRWWDEVLQTKRCKEYWARAERRTAEMKTELARQKAEELKAEEIRKAKHGVWMKCHVALCSEIAAPGNPSGRNLERWIGRLAGVNAMGFAALQDIKEMGRGLHLDQARGMLRLALATNVVALYAHDEEVVVAQAKVEEEAKAEAETKGTEETKATKALGTVPAGEPRGQSTREE